MVTNGFLVFFVNQIRNEDPAENKEDQPPRGSILINLEDVRLDTQEFRGIVMPDEIRYQWEDYHNLNGHIGPTYCQGPCCVFTSDGRQWWIKMDWVLSILKGINPVLELK